MCQPVPVRYLITGATGFVGGALTRLLRAEGHSVVALVRDTHHARSLKDSGVTLRTGDITDVASVREALLGVDGVFHVAGWFKVGVRDTAPGWQVNVEGTRNVLAAAIEAGTPRLVYTSTLAVNSDTAGETVDETYEFSGTHLTAYDASKAAAHELVRQTSPEQLQVVTVMPGGIYGPGDTGQIGALMAQVADGRRVVATAGPTMCQAHVDDIARGHLLAMERGTPGESYMLAGPQTGLGDLLDLVAAIARTRRPVRVPSPVVSSVAVVTGGLGRVIRLPPTYSAESLRVASASYLGSPAKAERELGWSARSLRQGVAETVVALRRRSPSNRAAPP